MRGTNAIEQFASYLRSAYAPLRVRSIRLEADATSLSGWTDDAAVAVVVGRADLDARMARHCLRPAFVGWSSEGERVAVLAQRSGWPLREAPSHFRVAAIVPVFNEADVIGQTMQYLVDDGIGVYVVDNWSTDATVEIVRGFEGRGLLGIERHPSDGAASVYDLRGILERVEALAKQLDADWIVLHDADERRRSPWPGVSLRDALYHVDRAGYSCIDHVTLNFWPIDDGHTAAHDVETYFPYFEFSDHAGHFHQRRAWKTTDQRVSLAATAGHDVDFQGRRVYPYKFLLKHYPVRSQSHAERKVLHERRARWNPTERALGWHQQYDAVRRFIRDPDELEYFDPRTFYERRLIERLSGVGIFDRPPEWATPPSW